MDFASFFVDGSKKKKKKVKGKSNKSKIRVKPAQPQKKPTGWITGKNTSTAISKLNLSEGKPAAQAWTGDPDNPCRAQPEIWKQHLQEDAKAIGGTFYISDKGEAMINPNGQSYNAIAAKLRGIGYSSYPNIDPRHWGGKDFRAWRSTDYGPREKETPYRMRGFYYHLTLGYPKYTYRSGFKGLAYRDYDYNQPPSYIVIDARCLDPYGGDHIWWYLFGSK
jgi:hypothetical protein